MNVLGLVTARGGSKGIPGKNLALCHGRPLIDWTIQSAQGARCISRTLVSTDDVSIAEHSRTLGAEVPFLRPSELASDTARSIDVATHAVGWLRDNGWAPDVVVLLQPTSPLRTSQHIEDAFALLDADAESVCSVVEVPHSFNPWLVRTLREGYLGEYQQGDLPFDRYRRQGQPKLYALNGPVVIVSRIATIDAGTFYGERCVPYFMNARDSLDIDHPEDLELADWFLSRRESPPA